MNIKKNTLTVLRHEEPDRVPWLPDEGVLPSGSLERKLRNIGMGLHKSVRVYDVVCPHVRVEERKKGDIIRRIYKTPVGNVSTIETLDFALYEEFFRIPWMKEFMIKNVADFEVVKFMIEDTEYHPNYKRFLNAEHWMDDDGLVSAGCERSPFHRILIEFTGFKNGIILLHRFPKEFEELRRVIEKKQDEIYGILADSPADIVLSWDNIDGVMISPRLFEKYYLQFYNRQARLLHKKGKTYACHMDGRLGCLKDLIGQTELDVINAFTPPPMGDLPISVARATWKDKVIWVNFPENVCLYGVGEVRNYTVELLREGAPGKNFIVGVTETVPPKTLAASLTDITEVMKKYGKYPLAQTEGLQ